MHLFHSYEEFLRGQCAHCSRIFNSSDKRLTKLKLNAEFSESQPQNKECHLENDVTNFEAICFIYGMSPKYLADKFKASFNSYSKEVQDYILVLDSEICLKKSKMLTFCSVCGPLFSEMFRINQTFRNLSDEKSFLFKTLKEVFCPINESFKSALVERDIKTETDSSASEDTFLEDPLKIDENDAESENALFETPNIKEEIFFKNVYPDADTAEFCQVVITEGNPISGEIQGRKRDRKQVFGQRELMVSLEEKIGDDEGDIPLAGPLNNSGEGRYSLRRRTKRFKKYDDELELSDNEESSNDDSDKSFSDFHDSPSELSEDLYESDDKNVNAEDCKIGDDGNDLNEEKEKPYTTIRLKRTSSKSGRYKYICKKCGNTFFSTAAMNSHLVNHIDYIEYPVHPEDIKGPPYICPICKREFQQRISVKVHCSKVHQLQILPVYKLKPGKNNFHTCSDCGLNYESVEGLSLHTKKIHGNTLYEGFKDQSDWLSHMDSHKLETSPGNLAGVTDDLVKPRKRKKVPFKRRVPFRIDESGNEVLICTECTVTFSSTKCLRKHKLLKHTKNVRLYNGELKGPPFKCPECENMFSGRETLKNHCLKRHSLKIPTVRQNRSLATYLQCNECGKSFDTSQGFSVHQRVKHNKTCFICVLCDKYFETEKDLDSHQLKAHQEYVPVEGEKPTENKDGEKYCEEPYFCRECNFTFKTKLSITSHLRKCRPLFNNYDCMECPEVFTNAMTLLHHLSSVHNLFAHPEAYKDSYWCTAPKCGEAFTGYKALLQHLRKANHESYQITCAFCEKQFDELQDLNLHKQISHFEKDVTARKLKMGVEKRKSSYKCRFCNESFPTHKEMSLHRQSHPKEEKIYKCTECPKTYTNDNSLRQHLHTIHSDEKFQCEECGKTIVGIRIYRKHCKAHSEKMSGVKPLCDLCGKYFSTKKQLYKHKYIMHFKREERHCHICGYVSKTGHYFKTHMNMHARNGIVKRRKKKEDS